MLAVRSEGWKDCKETAVCSWLNRSAGRALKGEVWEGLAWLRGGSEEMQGGRGGDAG